MAPRFHILQLLFMCKDTLSDHPLSLISQYIMLGQEIHGKKPCVLPNMVLSEAIGAVQDLRVWRKLATFKASYIFGMVWIHGDMNPPVGNAENKDAAPGPG